MTKATFPWSLPAQGSSGLVHGPGLNEVGDASLSRDGSGTSKHKSLSQVYDIPWEWPGERGTVFPSGNGWKLATRDWDFSRP